MEHRVGIDVSLELSSLCVLDATGKVIREAKVASEPEALVAFLRGLGVTIVRVGLEAGPLSQWLYDGLQSAGFETVLLETRHVKAALSAMAIKTDRRDARGIAQLLRMGWYRPVHRKSVPSQEVRALLAARKQMQIKAMDLEQTLRGLLRGFGLKVGDVSRGKLAARIRELVSGHVMLERIAEPMLTAREALWSEFAKLHREVLAIVKEDQVCRRLMTVPGVGAVVSLTYRAGVDDPGRFRKIQVGGRLLRLDAQALPIRRDGRYRRDHAGGRCGRANGLARRGQRAADTSHQVQHAQALGNGRCQAAGHAEGEGGAGAQAGHRAPSHLG